MKSTFSEAISTFRKKIRLQLLTALLLIVAIVGVRLLWHPEGEFEKGCSVILVLGVVLVLSAFIFRRYSLLRHLQSHSQDTFPRQLEEEIAKSAFNYKSKVLIRMVAGLVFILTMLAFVFIEGKSYSTGMLFTGCVLFILASFLYGWILMTDEMSLQDLRHHYRDQSSDIS